jgi:hypothetical protein
MEALFSLQQTGNRLRNYTSSYNNTRPQAYRFIAVKTSNPKFHHSLHVCQVVFSRSYAQGLRFEIRVIFCPDICCNKGLPHSNIDCLVPHPVLCTTNNQSINQSIFGYFAILRRVQFLKNRKINEHIPSKPLCR